MIKIESKGNYEIHHPPDRLTTKVDRDSGMTFDEIEERAEKNIESLVDQFLESVSESVTSIQKALSILENKQGTAVERGLIFDHCHDLKGMGGSFDFPLISFDFFLLSFFTFFKGAALLPHHKYPPPA